MIVNCAVNEYTYIAYPACLICGNLYPYAGVLGVGPGDAVIVYREAKLRNAAKVSWHSLRNMVREQSATVCRLAQKVIELEQSLLAAGSQKT